MEKNRFVLKKVKLLKGGGLAVEYDNSIKDGDEVFGESITTENTKDVHPDFMDLLNRLKPFVARMYNYTFFREIVTKHGLGFTPEQANAFEAFYSEILEKIRITGVALSGSEDAKGCVITALFQHENKVVSPINGHRIRFSETRYGNEQELEEIVDGIIEETFLYLFENKRSQLDIFENPSVDLFNQALPVADDDEVAAMTFEQISEEQPKKGKNGKKK